MKKKLELSNLILVCLVVFLFYYSYRYILKYNSEGTSPTYSNTPMIVQLIKYLILIVDYVLMFIILFLKKMQIRFKKTMIVSAIMLVITTYSIIFTRSNDVIIFLLCFLSVFISLLYYPEFNFETIDKIMTIFLYFSIIYEFVQIVLFVAINRLPALAYDTGVLTDVRFGGPWDDPNGFSLLLSFYIPYTFLKYDGIKKIMLPAILFMFLILSWSLTGIAIVMFMLCMLYIYKIISSKMIYKKDLYIIGSLFVLVALGAIVLLYSNSFWGFISRKSESISEHLLGFDFSEFSILSILGLRPFRSSVEPGIMRLLSYGGILFLILFFVISFVSILRLYKMAIYFKGKNKTKYTLLTGMIIYQISILISCINFAFIFSFANAGIFFVFMCISFSYDKELVEEEYKLF